MLKREKELELIASFDGLVKTNPGAVYNLPHWHKKPNRNFMGYTHQLKYDSSWDWLMPVVVKIFELKPNNDFFCHLNFPVKDIKDVYKPVVQFIEWYNSNINA